MPKPANRRSADDMLFDAYNALKTARFGLRALTGPNEAERPHGLRVVIAFGSATTEALKYLKRHGRTEYDEWWTPYEQELKSDPLLRLFIGMRNRVLHEGIFERVSHSIVWTPSRSTVRFVQPDERLTHRGQPVADNDKVEVLAALYLDYLEEVVVSAGKRFGTPPTGMRLFLPPMPWC